MLCYALFETAIGWAGLAWGEAGLVAVHLPEADPQIARRGLLRRVLGAAEAEPPRAVRAAMDAIADQLAGKPTDLTGVPLDLSRTPEFHARVYEIARAIPPGETLTYGEIAERLGDKLLARDVGQALGNNPWPIVVPCHRVTAANGKLGGFSASGGANTKLKLLAIEGAKAAAQGDLFA
ncbi:MAG: methylated-DNA--[protein]-cysteine S-methyltransferase [Alphaproteobacteria bacterium]|nr:methylated-DNA--[protein]-cysteine S-methyltransferase [Alphaproteobacteria bacterium]